MSTSKKMIRLNFEEYLQQEESADFKSEFYQGEVFAMSGGTRNHAMIGANAVKELGIALNNSDCIALGSDLKVRIEAAGASVYPDAMVICGPEQFYLGRKDIVTNPRLVVEILSEGTAAWDRGGKFRRYTQLPSLMEYVLIEQREAQIDVLRRGESGLWELEAYSGLNASVELKSIGITLNSGSIYYRVDFDQE